MTIVTSTMEKDDDVEAAFVRPRQARKLKKAAKPITIKITSTFNRNTDLDAGAGTPSPIYTPVESHLAAMVDDDTETTGSGLFADVSYESMASEVDKRMVDKISFFQETHEDQDPAFIAFEQKVAEEDRQTKLAALDALDQQTRVEIETIISDLCKEKQAATDRSLEKYKQRAAEEEKAKMEKYAELYRQKTASNMRKINEGIEILQQRHQKDLQNAMGLHQQQVRSRRLNEQMAAAEWNATSQNITNKFNQQLTAFRNKGNDLKKQTEADYQREQEKIHKQHLLRLQEVDSSRQKLHARLYQQIQQLRQRYLKRHLQKLMKDKEGLLSQGPAVAMSTNADGSSIENVDSYEGDILANALRPFPNQRDGTKSATDERTELNPSSPIRSAEKWVEKLQHPVAGASARHKHRKGVMSQTIRQLSIEIHNEGLWLSSCPPDSADNASDKKNESATPTAPIEYEFVPWGAKAFFILEAIVAGEIPPGVCEAILAKHPSAAEIMSAQAGQVRCIVSDMRTSEETASSHRVVAMSEQEQSQLKDMEAKISEMQKLVSEAEAVCGRAVQDEKDQAAAVVDATDKMAKATRIQEEFKQKFKSFLGPDGDPIPEASANDRLELSKAMSRYNSDLESATNKVKATKQAQTDAKSKMQKLQAVVKSAQTNLSAAVAEYKRKQLVTATGPRGDKAMKSFETPDVTDRSFFRVKDVVGALRKTADRRRDQADQKKSTSFSSAWVQSFPNLPSSLKKSLWHKMHRRKQQIILRPSQESLITELRENIGALIAGKYSGRSNADKADIIESEQLKAEQLYLLATHPFSEETLASVPPTKSSDGWGEPGWQLNLSVYDDTDDRSHMILPCAKSFPVLESNLSEIASAPGRQAASLIRPSHFSCLASPLSTFAVASSPAESNTSLTNIRAYSNGDPLHITDDDMILGYAFTLKPPVPKPTVSRKKPASSKASVDMDTSGDATQASAASTGENNSKSAGQATSKAAEPKKTEAKRRRSNPKKTTTSSSTTSRSKKQKQEATPAAPPMPTVGAHFNPMMQQQPPPRQQQQQRQPQQVHHQQQRQPIPPHQQQVIQPQRQSQHHQVQRPPSQHPPPHQHQPQHQGQLPHPSQHPQQPQYSPQMAQLHMMQQQQAISPRHQQVPANFPPQTIQQMQQFYAPLNHPPPPMHMQGRPGPPHQPAPQPNQPGQSRNQGGPNDSNDPLFMLK